MDILGKQIADDVARFCEESIPVVETATGHPLEWEWDHKLPEGFQARNTLNQKGSAVVHLRPPKRDDVFNAVVAHEVGHLLLNAEGYPKATGAQGVDPRLPLVFYNALVDPAVNERVTAAGIDLEPQERLLLANVIRGLFDKKVHEPTVLDVGNSGLWTLTFLSMLLKDVLGISKDFERILHGRYATTLQRTVALLQEVRAAGLDSPGGCKSAMELVRERLKLQTLVLIEETPAPAE